MTKKILLIGCGNLGKRYLEAIAKIKEDYELVLYDINSEALTNAGNFIVENKLSIKNHKLISDFNILINCISVNDIVIHCATAKNRLQSLELILEKSPEILFVEKPVVQTIAEFEKLTELSDKRKTKIFVHYALRFQPFAQHLKEIVSDEIDFQYISSLPKMGLACVGIHQIDLFGWLFGVKKYQFTNSNYYGTYEQKRKGFYDVYGEIQLITNNNGYATFSNIEIENARSIYINTKKSILSIQEDLGSFTLVENKKSPEIREVKFRNIFASEYLTGVIESFLTNKYQSIEELVDLKGSYFSHKIIFDYLDKHNLSGLNIT